MRSKKPLPKPAALDELPKLDEHLCFALYAAGNHMTRLFVPFLKTLGVTYSGCLKSWMAAPSRRNSGFDTTAKSQSGRVSR